MEVWNKDLRAQVELEKAQIKANRASANQACTLKGGAIREAQRIRRLQKYNQIVSEEQVDNKVTNAEAQQAACTAAREAVAVSQATLEAAQAAIESCVAGMQ